MPYSSAVKTRVANYREKTRVTVLAFILAPQQQQQQTDDDNSNIQSTWRNLVL
jgi:hypothetical protein